MFPLAPFEKDLKIFNVKTKNVPQKNFKKKLLIFRRFSYEVQKRCPNVHFFTRDTFIRDSAWIFVRI